MKRPPPKPSAKKASVALRATPPAGVARRAISGPDAAAPEAPRVLAKHISSADRKMFRAMLLKRRTDMANNVHQMEDEALHRSRQDASGDLSTMPIHQADLGTDNYEQEFTLELIQSEAEELQEIENALERLDLKTYGVCDTCNKPIPKERLKAIPYAVLCIECKRKQEEAP